MWKKLFKRKGKDSTADNAKHTKGTRSNASTETEPKAQEPKRTGSVTEHINEAKKASAEVKQHLQTVSSLKRQAVKARDAGDTKKALQLLKQSKLSEKKASLASSSRALSINSAASVAKISGDTRSDKLSKLSRKVSSSRSRSQSPSNRSVGSQSSHASKASQRKNSSSSSVASR